LETTPVTRIEHRRFILFVKPHYFVIYDHIPQTTLPATCWMHALADTIEIAGQRARLRGRYGVDLDVQVLQPVPATIHEGTYSCRRHIRIDQPGAGDYLTILTPLPSSARPPVTTRQRQNLIRVIGSWGEDEGLISPSPCSVEHRTHRLRGTVILFRNGSCIPLAGVGDDRGDANGLHLR
jgi:hypothetical protein